MSGVLSIIEMIETKAAKKEDRIIKDAEESRRIKLLNAKKKSKANTNAMMVKAQIQSRANSVKLDANARLAARYQILEAKEVLVTETFKLITVDLAKKCKTKRYTKILTDLAVEGGSILAVEQIELVLPRGQKPQLDLAKIGQEITRRTGIKTKVSLSKENVRAIGGVIIRSKDNLKWVDNTFDARKNQMLGKIRNQIATILFEGLDTSI